jgi:hypothetical protein
MGTLKFGALAEEVRPQAEEALSPETKRDVLIMVAGVVRQILREADQSEK